MRALARGLSDLLERLLTVPLSTDELHLFDDMLQRLGGRVTSDGCRAALERDAQALPEQGGLRARSCHAMSSSTAPARPGRITASWAAAQSSRAKRA